ncbi:hypothetical protein M9Y10_035265 [Tritrichomonas musculus]|uniref:AttH domain-containing protein n=1 Tax=Tritrichomonas musculus TaxID=1915356 RepID=A0ABR2KH74_9EUKA
MKCIPLIIIGLLLAIGAQQYFYHQNKDYPPLYPNQMQNEITEPLPLLDNNGKIIKEGWARRPFWQYERAKVKDFTKLRTKEWDYYLVVSQKYKFGVAATISDLNYGGLFALTYIDLENCSTSQIDTMQFFTFGGVNLSSKSNIDNVVKFSNKDFSIHFERQSQNRYIIVSAPTLKINGNTERVGLWANLTLKHPDALESMNIATSWKEDRSSFYLNEKVTGMKAYGTVKVDETTININSDEDDTYAVLDWGRGKWTYQNRWYWGSLSAKVDGGDFAFNLGYGFSDRSPATENVLIYNNVVSKIGNVIFDIPVENGVKMYMKNWKIKSDDGRLNMDFVPVVDRSSLVNFLVIKSDQHQVFGKFSGNATLDDGRILNFSNIYAFAEDVFNRW